MSGVYLYLYLSIVASCKTLHCALMLTKLKTLKELSPGVFSTCGLSQIDYKGKLTLLNITSLIKSMGGLN